MFITNNQMLSMLLAPILPLLLALGGCALLYHFTDKKRTGILHSFGFGLVAFALQTIAYELIIILVQRYESVQNILVANRLMQLLMLPLVYSVLIAGCFCWGVERAIDKEGTLIRSAACGIGFGMGNVVWNILIPYVSSMYYAARINTGSFVWSDELAMSVYQLKPLTVVLDSAKSMYFIVIYMALGYVTGRYLNNQNKGQNFGKKQRTKSFLIVFLVQFLLSFSNALLKLFATSTLAVAIMHVLLLAVTAICVYVIYKWLKK